MNIKLSRFSQKYLGTTRKSKIELDEPIFRIFSPSSTSTPKPGSKHSPKISVVKSSSGNKRKLKIKKSVLRKGFIQPSPSSVFKSRTPPSKMISSRQTLSKYLNTRFAKLSYKRCEKNQEELLVRKMTLESGALPEIQMKKKIKVVNLVDLVKFIEPEEEDAGDNQCK